MEVFLPFCRKFGSETPKDLGVRFEALEGRGQRPAWSSPRGAQHAPGLQGCNLA